MTDRELLELAAKAAGIGLAIDGSVVVSDESGLRHWNPLADEGDALRLAVKLGMEIYVDTHCNCVEAYSVTHDPYMKHRAIANIDGDPYAAARRAIVRAAAEIGKEMK